MKEAAFFSFRLLTEVRSGNLNDERRAGFVAGFKCEGYPRRSAISLAPYVPRPVPWNFPEVLNFIKNRSLTAICLNTELLSHLPDQYLVYRPHSIYRSSAGNWVRITSLDECKYFDNVLCVPAEKAGKPEYARLIKA